MAEPLAVNEAAPATGGTQVQVLQAQVLALQAQLAAVRAEAQEFTVTVSHDLRAPLRHIVSFARLLQDEAGPQLQGDSADFLRTVVESAQRMDGLIEALAALSRLAGVPVHMQPLALAPLVQRSLNRVAARYASGPGHALRTEVQLDVPADLWVRADEALLEQALVHLLDNAFKFRQPTAQARVLLRAQRCTVADVVAAAEVSAVETWAAAGPAAGMVALCIEDNGVGYAPAAQGKLFKVFGRLHPAKQFVGLGMGLLTARRLLDKLGASVDLHTPAPACAASAGGGVGVDAGPGAVATVRLREAPQAQ